MGSQIEETKSKKELDEMYYKQEHANEKPKWIRFIRSMLHYGGIFVAFIGVLLIAGPFNIYAGNPEFDAMSQVLGGSVFIIIGTLMFLLIEE